MLLLQEEKQQFRLQMLHQLTEQCSRFHKNNYTDHRSNNEVILLGVCILWLQMYHLHTHPHTHIRDRKAPFTRVGSFYCHKVYR